jgi:S-adenosylmethionine:tRNA ribosyltransferase-isomerase
MTAEATPSAPAVHTTFDLPAGREATAPPEHRGLARDEVRLLVATEGRLLVHTEFQHLADHLRPGDLLVVNTSATVPAALDGIRLTGERVQPVVVHVAGPAAPPQRSGELATDLVLELRRPDQSGPVLDAEPGEEIALPSGALARLIGPHGAVVGPTRLWRARVVVEGPVASYLERHGRPVSYAYVGRRFPIADYQTVVAREPGSAEMPSAGRPLSSRVLGRLADRGIAVATVLLHTGLSSLEAHEPPQPERFRVPGSTARAVNRARETGRRVVAVGTTVTRALETVARPDGVVRAGAGWTDLVLGPDRPARVVSGLVTGWHAPEASHLALLEAVAGTALVQAAYDEAVRCGYLWHEFGDSCLLLPTL